MQSDRGWYYLVEPESGRWAPPTRRLATPDGRVLTVRHHGSPGRVEVLDPGKTLPVATLLRAARAVGERLPSPVRVVLGAGPARVDGDVFLDGAALAAAPSPWSVEADVAALVATTPPHAPVRAPSALPARPVPRVLFFESLMNAELPHNDAEISQGVLHMISALAGTGTEVVLANVKMAITGTERPVLGLESLAAAVTGGRIGLVCITLLEGYWPGVVSLVRELRALGCRGHVALGGVMPTLTPEHVAAHFPDVTFVCRGAGEYFLPHLARIVGDGDIDTPLTEAQVGALLELDGLLVVDRAGGRVLSADSARVVQVADLDRVPLELAWVTPAHLAAGVELSTSRGCLHRCTFCSIIGRESYQARSAGGVFDLLGQYDGHYAALFGEGPRDTRGRNTAAPRNGYRVHISDDDFACDRDRAIAFFTGLRHTPFRLASCQVSIADLCRRADGRLLPEPDTALLDVITPDCFDDHGASIPARDFVADHRSRGWSSFLQIGVESFSDRELARLGKGYQRAHVRAIVGALAARGLHHDAYFILSNADTSPADLVDVLDEVVRLKIQSPVHFHVRFPVVPHLVSYFPSASYRRRLRQGEADSSVLRDRAAVPGHPEVDYPFVDHDAPRDPNVAAAVAAGVFTDEQWYAGSYDRLRALFVARAQAGDPDAEHLARVVDDRLRRRLFELLDAARRNTRNDDPAPERALRAVAEAALGPIATWLPAFQRHTQGGVTRLVVIPTWQCELRCNYCYIPKQDGRVMTRATLERSIDLLLSSERPALTLQFFGGEALLEWDLVRHAIAWGSARAAQRGKTLDFVLSSNGWSLTAERLDWLRTWPVKLELSLDGDPEAQRSYRPARRPGDDSYAHGIAPRAAAIVASGLAYDVIMVVHPQQVHRLVHNYLHIVDLGFSRVQINCALGKTWSPEHRRTFAAQLFALAGALRERPGVTLVNAEHAPMPMRLNAEITVDWDGAVYGGNAFLHETEHKDRFRLGHLDDHAAFDRYWMDAPANAELVAWSYPAEVTANNLKVGAILTDFLRWYRGEIPTRPTAARGAAP
jgi:MoaA/NifB/PqqE/SkfB family radical SAM enzyme